ncbi:MULTISPECIES: hypothetical protein [Halomicrobium]|uniref:Uncharacterized protein n=2 Tax=Halomicrobium mukohataei TaxID=57705 RepID=C7NX99_HALMD|nr:MULTISPECIES: hypothetical protein [Halomicrobium]ACV48333.1 conserved hypothetical protein [Halomicrobium mukohataei DSM 12286]QCD66748.1 hypothetical protein E5139_14235 [Halomicrobium mukohataei]QFR21553.1 hypothetical protein GBQ70_14250 [Halomicrobium sp. ZPS1]
MPSSRFVAVACLVIFAVTTLAVAPVVGAPPPRPLCDACGDSFAETASAHGVEATVVESTATVQVARNGTATWTVRNTLREPAAERLRANESLRTAIADRAMWDVTLLGSNVSSDGVLTLRYREPDFAEPSAGGTLRSGAFTESHGYSSLDGLGADRLTVVAPEGMTVERTVPGATVSADRTRMTLTGLDRYGFLTFTERGDPLGAVWSTVALLALLGPVAALNAAVLIGLPTAVFGIVVAALCGAVSWLDFDFGASTEQVGTALGGLGVLTVLGTLAGAAISLFGTADAPLVGAGVGIAAVGATLTASGVRDRLSYRTVLALAGAGLVAAVGTAVVALPVFQQSGLLRSQRVFLGLLVALFAFLPAGYALGRNRHRLALATVSVGFAAALFQQGLPIGPLGLGILIALVNGIYGVVVVACGTPLLLAGREIGRADGRT